MSHVHAVTHTQVVIELSVDIPAQSGKVVERLRESGVIQNVVLDEERRGQNEGRRRRAINNKINTPVHMCM